MAEKPEIRLETEPLSAEFQKLAEDELRETPERVKESLEKLRELLKNDKTLVMKDHDDFLIRFLRPHKFYPDSALEAMRRAAQFKLKNASILDNLMPEDEQNSFLNSEAMNVIATRDGKGRRILLMNSGSKWDPSQINTDQLFRVLYLIHLAAMLEPQTQVCGVVVIIDFDGLSMKQIKGLSPIFALRLLTFCQDAMPLRLKEIHITRQPFIFNMIWAMFKPFIKDKLKKRIFFHGSKMESLHKHLDPKHLPKDFGGELPAINYSGVDWYPVLRSTEENIKEWNSCGVVTNK